MSNLLAIASVTQVLKGILNDGLADADLPTLGGGITAFPPDKIDVGGSEKNQLNIYMYMLTPNQGWKNKDFPSHNAQGQRISNPFLALDLQYVISAYGTSELIPEMLLGYAMQVLHENPVLARELIRLQLTPEPTGPLPTALNMLSTSGLAEQIEQIKITPDMLSTEEVSRLWTSFGTKHRQSAYFKVTVVLIESKKQAGVAFPVKKPLIYVQPFKQPVITQISSRSEANAEIIDNQKILSGFELVIIGAQLKGELVSVVIGGVDIPNASLVSVKDSQIILPIPDTIKAGVHPVQVNHKIKMGEPLKKHKGLSSNMEAFVLSPQIKGNVVEKSVQVDGNSEKAVQMEIVPMPDETQEVELFLNQLNNPDPEEYSFSKDFSKTIDPAPPAGKITIPIGNNVKAGNYLVRVRIDKSESWIANNYRSPEVIIT